MPARRSATLGPQTTPITLRTRIGQFEWGGAYPDGDAAAVPDNRPRELINARLRDGTYIARAGQSKFNSAALHSASAVLSGLHDFRIATPYSLWLCGDGCPSVSGSVGWFVGFYDVDQSPAFQGVVYYNSTTQGVVLKPFDSDLYIGQDTYLRRLTQIKAPWGTSQLSLATQGGLDVLVLELPAGFTEISCLEVFNGRLFIGAVQGSGTSQVMTYDGVTEEVDLPTIEEPRGFILYREGLILGYDGVPNHIRFRSVGAAPGTWATIAPGAGTVAMRGNGAGCSYKDEAWWASGGDSLWKFDGTNVTEVPAATTGITAGAVTHSCFPFGGNLYVTYYVTGGSPEARLAKFDGAVWTAVEKDFILDFPDCTFVGPMASYRNCLVVGASDDGTGAMYESDQADTAGTYAKLTPSSPSNGQINHVVTF